MKRIIFILITILSCAFAVSAATKGKCGDNVRWALDEKTGVLTISGKGAMYNNPSLKRWDKKKSQVKKVIIGEGVTSIGDRAFSYHSQITSVSIPRSVTTIGADAFRECPKLKYIYINDLTAWCKIDFANNNSNPAKFVYDFYINDEPVTHLVIPKGITTIKDYAFYGCYCFYSITIPDGVKTIGNHSFDTHGDLTITIPGSVTSFGTEAVSYGRVKEIYYTGSLEDWCTKTWNPQDVSKGYSLYINNRKLTSVVVPKTVTRISDNAFYNCLSITDVYIQQGITYIGENAFSKCEKLKKITLPGSIKEIGKNAFEGCAVKDLYYSGSLEDWCTKTWNPKDIDIPAWYRLYIDDKLLKTVVIPQSVKKISDNAFYNCGSIKEVYLQKNVTNIGSNAFNSCHGLESIVIPSSVQTIGEDAFKGCTKYMVSQVVTQGTVFFAAGTNLTIYTNSSVDMSKSGLRDKQHAEAYGSGYNTIVKLTEDELQYKYPFSIFAQGYVKKGVNEWQKKGEFERTPEWQARVNEQTRQIKIQDLLDRAEQDYISNHVKEINVNPYLGKYDADNEVFAVIDNNYGKAYIAVPLEEAQDFKANWKSKQMKSKLHIIDDQISLSSLAITMPNGKQYTYRNTDVVNYNLAEIKYNFDPIDFDFHKNTTPQQNQQNNQKSTIRAGKSLVDTDIPETNASNPNTFVLIFANEDYKNAASVPFAKNDGTIFQKYCQKTLGIPAKNIHYVENATYNDMRIQLSWAKDVCEAFDGQASLIVYYTGHGIPDEASGASYLLPVDGDGRYVASAYNLDEFYQKLGAMNAKSVTVLLDACFSGASRDGNMVVQAKGVVVKPKPGTPQGKTVVFAAAQDKETAGFNEAEGHGMFTYFLLKKLQETKGDVTLKDLGDYIITNVKQQSVVQAGKKQTPTVLSSPAVSTVWKNWKLK